MSGKFFQIYNCQFFYDNTADYEMFTGYTMLTIYVIPGVQLAIFQFLHEQYFITLDGFIAWEESEKEPEGKG